MAWLDLAARIPQERFAQLVGIGQPAVSALVARGVLARDGRAGEWLQAYTGHLREQAAGRVEVGPLSAERQRLTKARADRAELELRELAGSLVSAADVQRETFATWRTVRDAVLAIPPRLAPLLAGAASAAHVDETLATELRAVLRGTADAIGAGSTAWIEPLTRALGREIETWGRSSRPDVPEDLAALRARLARVCEAFATGRLSTLEDTPCHNTATA